MPTPPIGSHARSGTRSGLVAGGVLVAAAGDLLLLPLMSLRIASVTLLALAALGLLQSRHVWPAVRSGFVASLRRAPAPWAFVVFVVALLAWTPLAYLRSPDPGAARAELTGLLTGVLLAAGVLAATVTRRSPGGPHRSAELGTDLTPGGPNPSTEPRATSSPGRQHPSTRPGTDLSSPTRTAPDLSGWRLGWVLGLGLAVLTATVELLTGRHVHADESLAWTLDPTIVAGPFRNPNDFAAALSVMVGGTIAYRAGVSRPAARWGLALLASLGVAAVLLTQSRGGLVAIVLVLAIHALRVLLDRRSTTHPKLFAANTRARTVTWSLAGSLVLAATIAAFTVPALVRLNPIAATIAAAGQPGTARSDTLRLDLIRAGWRYFTESDRLGTGAGSFEYLLAHDPNPGVSTIIWMHNSFLEFLLQYGVVVTAVLAAVTVAVLASLATLLRRAPTGSEHGPTDPGHGPTDPGHGPTDTGHGPTDTGHGPTDTGHGPTGSGPPENPTADREHRLVAAETLGALVGFAALGSLAYTALETHVWWMMLAQAVAGAWWLTSSVAASSTPRSATPAMGQPARADAH